MAYSTDLRERVLAYIETGNTITEASRIFKVTRQTILKWRRVKEEKGSVAREVYRHGVIKLNDQELIAQLSSVFGENHPKTDFLCSKPLDFAGFYNQKPHCSDLINKRNFRMF